MRPLTRHVLLLGGGQTLGYASSYYLPALLAAPMAQDTGLPLAWAFAAFSLALIVSGVVGPAAGRAVDRYGGRRVLLLSNLLFAAGLLAMAGAQGPVSLFAAWSVLGLAMGAGLYESAFAALVGLHGLGARGGITGITLLGGFASTLGWPLSAWMEVHWGWRGACLGWAALHLLVGLPLHAWLPRQSPAKAYPTHSPKVSDEASARTLPSLPAPPRAKRTALLLSLVFAVAWFGSTALATHLPQLLQEAGLALPNAVAVASLVGPAQVAGRLLDFGLLRRLHPLLAAKLAAAAHPVGAVLLLLLGAPAALAFTLLHGAGNGVLTIAKGTLPLVYFGTQGYGERQGVLMVPARIAQALAPVVFGALMQRVGIAALLLTTLLGALAWLALSALGEPPAATQTRTTP
ncbi:MFS transporter [Simplicispira suum]|uniref:MFS transporter n=1 Tax=Simplicispira suum TaxID=2109915 RepID=A0A2S0MZZ8_9BURK|nr:MFS transporter [Simplicispira suum]AVO41474.1 MFS transporter [Simplicispira suum]